MTEHHPTHPPSSAQRLLGCPGSPQVIETTGARALTTRGASLGQELHRVVAERGTVPCGLTAEERALVSACWNWIDDAVPEPREEHVEQRVDIVLGELRTFGTVDLVRIDGEGTAHVVDWKFYPDGSIPTSARDQLRMYSIGIATWLQPERIRAYAFNPYFGTSEEWDYELDVLQALQARYATRLKRSDIETGEHCRWCPALGSCDTARGMILARSFYLEAPNAPVSLQLEVLQEADRWLKARRKVLTDDYLKSDMPDPRVQIVENRGRLDWTDKNPPTPDRLREEVDPDLPEMVIGRARPLQWRLLRDQLVERLVADGASKRDATQAVESAYQNFLSRSGSSTYLKLRKGELDD